MLESDGYRIMQEKGLGDNWSFAYMETAARGKTVERSQLHWEKTFETTE